MSVLRRVKNALAYAKFDSPDINLAVIDLLNEVDLDLDHANYKQSDAVDESLDDLQRVLDETEVKKERLAEKLAELEPEEREYDDTNDDDED